MPDDKLTTEEIWLRRNAPEILEQMTADQIAFLKKHGHAEQLAKFLEGRSRIDKLWAEQEHTLPYPRLMYESDKGTSQLPVSQSAEIELKEFKAAHAEKTAAHQADKDAFKVREDHEIFKVDASTMSAEARTEAAERLKAESRVLENMLEIRQQRIRELDILKMKQEASQEP